MASFKQYTASGGASENFSINSFSSDEIKVRVDGVLKTAATHYNITNYTVNGGTVTWTSGNVPSSGTVRIYRITDLDPARATFSTGASLKAQDLNDNQTQVLRALEEENDQLIQSWDIENTSITSAKILDGTIVDADINASAAIAGTKISPNFGSQVIQTTGNITVGGTVDSRDINADGTKLDTIETNAKDDQTATEIRNLVDAATDSNVFTDADHSKLDNIAAQSNKYVHPNHSGDVTSVADGATTIANDAVTFAKFQNIAQDTILGRNSSGTGDPTALTSGEVRTLLNVENGATADQTDAEIKTAYENNSNTNAFTDSDKNFIADIDATATEINVLDGITSTTAELNFVDGVTSNVQTQLNAKQALDAELTELATMSSGTASALADLTQTEVQVLDGVTATTAEINLLDGVTASTTEINMLDNCTAVGTELSVLDGITANTSELNILDGVTADKDELNLLDGKSIVTTIAANATDVQLPTAQAVNERVVELVTEVGGFVPIANEVSFPNTNPDVNDGAGTIVSIADAGGVVVNGSGVSTTGRTLGGSTVTINGIDSSLNSTTIAAGQGMLVETTTTLNTYTYHRLVIDEAGVQNAKTAVDDFNERYRVGSSNPSSNNDDGDLFFNTTSDKMLVYNATGSSWDEVQSVGNYFINTISSYSGTGGNSATFNGSAYRFVLSNPGTVAEQHIVSVNGVIQKPTAGTSQPAEGFAIDGSSILFSSAPASGSDYFIITIGSSVNIGTPSNNTVTSAMIVDGSIVDGDISSSAAIAGSKLADDSITEAKLDIHAAPSGTDKFLKYTSNGMEWVVPSYTTNTDTVYTHPNHSGEVTSTGDGATVIADDVVDEANLKISNSGSNGQFLSKQSGNTGGLTWATVSSADTTYSISCVDGDNSDEEKIRLTAGGSGSGTDDVVLEAGTGLSIARSGDKITFTNTVADTTVGGATGVDFNDNVKARFGTGNDLEIYHDASNSHIVDSGTGSLLIKGDAVNLGSTGGEYYFRGFEDGAVYLRYDNSNKLETTSTGVTVYGDLFLDNDSTAGRDIHWDVSDNALKVKDNTNINFGDGNDLQLYHNGSHSYIDEAGTGDLYIRSASNIRLTDTSDNKMILCQDGGEVQLYYDGTQKAHTTTTGLRLDDSDKLEIGTSADLQIYHTGSQSRIENAGTGELRIQADTIQITDKEANDMHIECNHDGNVELYYDNAKKLETTAGGIQMNGDILVKDHHRIKIGDSQDLEFYHDTTDSWIKNNTGRLVITTNQFRLQNPGTTENLIYADTDGSVQLYHNGSKKLETTAAGGTLTGTWTGAGKILQVLQQVRTDTFSEEIGEDEYTADCMSLAITPSSASNKVLVMVKLNVSVGQDDQRVAGWLYKGGSQVTGALGDAASNRRRSTTAALVRQDHGVESMAFDYLDSPSTTSATTYSIRLSHGNASNKTLYLNRAYHDTDHVSYFRSTSSLILMEVSA